MFILLHQGTSFHKGKTDDFCNTFQAISHRLGETHQEPRFLGREALEGPTQVTTGLIHTHAGSSMEKFRTPLPPPPAGTPVLTWSQIRRLLCIFNIHLLRPQIRRHLSPRFPLFIALFLFLWFLPATWNKERDTHKAIFLLKNPVFLYGVSFPSEARGEREWA